MPLSTEQSDTLASDQITETDAEAIHEDAPADGEAKPAEKEPIREGILEDEAPADGEAKKDEAEGDKKPEDKPADAKADEQQRTWKAVEAAKKAQVQVAQAKRELAREVERVQDFARTLEAREQGLAQREAHVTKLERALQSRDLEALVELGFDYDGYTRRYLERQSPEGATRAANERIEKLEREIRERDQKVEAEARAARQVQETRQVAQSLVELVEDSPEECPELYAWAPERIAQEGIALRDAFFRKNGRMPTYDHVLGQLQKTARDEARVANERAAKLRQRSSGQASEAGSAGKVDSKAGSGGQTVPALTARTASVRATPPREQSEEELDEELKAEIRRGIFGR